MTAAGGPMTSREMDEAAESIACELFLIAFAIHGRTRPALAAAYAAVACSDAFEPGPGGSSGRPETAEESALPGENGRPWGE